MSWCQVYWFSHHQYHTQTTLQLCYQHCFMVPGILVHSSSVSHPDNTTTLLPTLCHGARYAGSFIISITPKQHYNSVKNTVSWCQVYWFIHHQYHTQTTLQLCYQHCVMVPGTLVQSSSVSHPNNTTPLLLTLCHGAMYKPPLRVAPVVK